MMKYIDRPVFLERLIKEKDRDIVKVITGIRRSGKSVLLFEIFYQYLLNQGIEKEQIIKVDLETYKNKQYRDAEKLYNHIVERIKDKNKKHYVFLDEIQLVPQFEDVVNGLRIDENCDVYVTGSNAQMLSKDINTKFRGRSSEIRVYPLSFAEYKSYKGSFNNWDDRKMLNEYLMDGGLPYVVQLDSVEEKHRYLNDICELTLFRDIVDRYNVRNENLLKAVFDLLCSQIGSYVSANKITNTLKSNGYPNVTSDTVGSYLEYFCDAFLMYKVQRYDIKGKAYLKTLNKYYVTDLGIRNSRLNFRQLEITHSIENLVYLELLRRGYIVDIGKNDNKEIDFVAKSGSETYYIQVSYTIVDKSTRQREIDAFAKLDDGYKKIIITMDDTPYTVLENGYKVLNLIEFFNGENILKLI
ncbi:MAG: ATP-binding protein [Alphaproteobacteria bacterium]|nr:ATP-binding protein [Alphaproteobacteria bacterium]